MKRLEPFEQAYEGKNLVEASAGTGKTYNIVWLYLRFLLKENLSVDEILVVTFTNAATKELKERLMNSIQHAIEVLKYGYDGSDAMLKALDSADWIQRDKALGKLEAALRSFDHAAVFTIHGFCKNVLDEMAFETRTLFDMELIGDDGEIVQEVIDDYWRKLVEQAETDEAKTILLKCLVDQSCMPDKLPGLLQKYIAKPYIKLLPENIEWEQIEQEFQSLIDVYGRLKEAWRDERVEIIQLLDPAIMSRYTDENMVERADRIDEMLSNEVPPVLNSKQLGKLKYFAQSHISENLLKAAKIDGIPPPDHDFFKQMDEFGDICKGLMLIKSVFLKELLHHLRQELPRKKQQLEVLSYDDLLLNVHQAINDEEKGDEFTALLREKHPVALVDEFQDTDPVQYEIFRDVYADSAAKLFMIGDPKQAIYSFRGADIFAYLRARNDTIDNQQYSLSQNFRSVPELLYGVNALFSQPAPFVLPEISFNPVEPGRSPEEYDRLKIDKTSTEPLRFITVEGDGESEIARAAALDVKKLITDGKSGQAFIGDEAVSPGDIAILVNTHKQGDLINEALAQLGIKSVQSSDKSVFHSKEAEELERVLSAIAEAGNESLIRAALITQMMGKTANDLYRFDEDEELWMPQAELFIQWNHDWQEHGFAFMFQSLLKEGGVAKNAVCYRGGERKLTNILHLGELLQRQEHDDEPGIRSLIKWLARKRREKKDGLEEEELRLESDEGLVKIVTIHRSKGLEYPVVFCPFLWKGKQIQNSQKPFLFHSDEKKEAYLDLMPKSKERKKRLLKYYEEELAERMRLAYVAITRAKQQCNIYWHGEAGRSEFSPLGYLLLGRESVMDQMRKKLKLAKVDEEIDEGVFKQAIGELKSKTEGLVSFQKWEEPTIVSTNGMNSDKTIELKAKAFGHSNRLLPRQISSFSSLMRDESEFNERDYDAYFEPGDESIVQDADKLNIFNFPKGPGPGTCVHHIFEQLNFSDLSKLDGLIENALESHDIAQKWAKPLNKNLQTVVNKPLIDGKQNFRLSNLATPDFVHEMEFYFDMKTVSHQKVMQIIGNQNYNSNSALTGFMKGYIDLTVQFDNRFYIIDYKTNFLGDQPEHYCPKSLLKEIQEKGYDLQYYIYTIAVHRYLKERLSDYHFEDHFGGVLYLFLRGINDDPNDFNGIHFDRPDFKTVSALDDYLKRGEAQ
ncbi:MAG TPA: exodeoxyribonuclease V subunit beta [Balneolaceae bacterium]|nr:exodeoxyribonuclease V subunit beta [Balneolaceae bacterium]